MKVVFVTREGYKLSGARVRCYNFSRYLGQCNIDSQVLSFADLLGARFGERECEMSFLQKISYNLKAYRALSASDKNTLLYMQRLNYHSLAPLLFSIVKRTKFIFDCDDWNIREDPKYYFGIYPSSKMEFFTKLIARFSGACVVASLFLKEFLAPFNDNVYYLPTGVDTRLFDPGKLGCKKDEALRLCWVGTAYHEDMYKNIIFIIELFCALAGQHPQLRLCLAGEGSYFQRVKNETASNPYRDRIEIDDWVDPDRMPEYLNAMDICLLPLIQDTKFNKAKSPTKIFEYMAMAKPTVASPIGESVHIIQDGENGMHASTKKDFLSKINLLIESRDLRLTLGCNARALIEKQYSLDVLGKDLYNIITSLSSI